MNFSQCTTIIIKSLPQMSLKVMKEWVEIMYLELDSSERELNKKSFKTFNGRSLTHFTPMFHFYPLKASGNDFLIFSEGVEMDC